MLLINGKETATISVADRGLQFGDGCFTTAAVYSGKIALLSAHIARLRTASERLNIAFSYWSQLKAEMQQLAQSHHRAVLKVMLTRGKGGYGGGYSPAQCVNPTRIVRIYPSWPCHYDNWRKNGISLVLSPVRLGRNPHLAGLKHLNRLEQVMIRAHLEQTAADEALVLDSDGWVTECSTANVFWRKNDIVYTPYLDQAGVDGVMRQFCLRMLALSSFQVFEVCAREEALKGVDEIVICNALMPIIPVREYGEAKFSSLKLFKFLAPLCANQNLI